MNKISVFPEKEWQRSTAERQGVSAFSFGKALKVLESYCAEDGIEQCLVIRNGYRAPLKTLAFTNIYSFIKI